MLDVENKIETVLADPKVVIVDDNSQNLKILFEMLDGFGYRLLLANTGSKAIELVEKNRPDLILLDIMLPDISGFEVCATFKKANSTKNIPVIFLSALSDLDSKVKGFEVGGVDYIAKPFQSAEVLVRVQNHLKLRQLEKTLERENLKLQADQTRILNSIREGIYGLDMDGKIIYANPTAAYLNHCSQDLLIGKDFFSLHFGSKSAVNKSILENAIPVSGIKNGLCCRSHNVAFIRPNGSAFPADYCITEKLDGELRVGAVVVFSDITESLQLQAQLDEAKRKIDSQRDQLTHVTRLSTMGEMAAGFAHELNQPLTAITNYTSVAQRLLGKNDCDKILISEILGKIQAQSHRASEVIQHLRDFISRPKGGKTTVDVASLVKETIAFSEVDILQHQCYVEADIEENLPTLVVDKVQIQQVLINLIRNALEASQDDKGTENSLIRILVKVDSDTIDFQVKDAGKGIAPEAVRRLFYPFNTTKKEGMGIGLTLCQSIVNAHGGKIYYRANLPKGAIFGFALPINSLTLESNKEDTAINSEKTFH
jgi:PAS domain S-box-containing protein